MNQREVADGLNRFWHAFTDFGCIQGKHLVYWNEGFAADDKARFIRVVEAVVRYAIDNGVPIPFDRQMLFFNKGDFDLYFRTVKAYTTWFYDTLTGILTSPANLTRSLRL